MNPRYLKGENENKLKQAESLIDLGRYEQAAKLISEARSQFSELRYARGVVDADRAEANLKFRRVLASYRRAGEAKREVPETLKGFSAALQKSEEIGYEKGMADAHKGMGSTLIFSGVCDLTTAIRHYQEALQLYKKIEYARGIGDAYGNLGIAYRVAKKYPLSIEYLKKSLEQHEKIGFRLGVGRQHVNLGKTYRATGDTKTGQSYLTRAVEELDALGDTTDLAIAQHTLLHRLDPDPCSRNAAVAPHVRCAEPGYLAWNQRLR